jgi:hypothetical protein
LPLLCGATASATASRVMRRYSRRARRCCGPYNPQASSSAAASSPSRMMPGSSCTFTSDQFTPLVQYLVSNLSLKCSSQFTHEFSRALVQAPQREGNADRETIVTVNQLTISPTHNRVTRIIKRESEKPRARPVIARLGNELSRCRLLSCVCEILETPPRPWQCNPLGNGNGSVILVHCANATGSSHGCEARSQTA